MDKKKKEILLLGATLFSMFFGAGNLIFPPALGFEAGNKWLLTFLGFLITGTGLPLLGIIAAGKSDGDITKLGERVSRGFSKFLGVSVVLCIGPLMAIPRTGATSYEIAIQPIWPEFSPIVFAIIYFSLAFILVVNPTDIVDRVGKILTPALLILLLLIIVLGIINPISDGMPVAIDSAFMDGFTEGYQTMDAFAALLFGGIIFNSIKSRGYDDPKDQLSMTLRAGLVSTIALGVIYAGLAYLGSTATGFLDPEISRVNLIMKIADNSLSSFGRLGLGIAVTLACLTTSIGLIATVGQYFSEISGGKLSYLSVVIVTTISSAILSVAGVDTIVEFSGPILTFLYPIVIVLILLTVFYGDALSRVVYKSVVGVTGVFSLLEVGSSIFNLEFLEGLISIFPLAGIGLGWILPAVMTFVVGKIRYGSALSN